MDNDTIEKLLNGSLNQTVASEASALPSADLLRQVEAARASMRPSADLLRQALGATIAPLSVVPNETRSESALSPSIASHQSDSQAIVRLFGYMDLFDALITDPGLIRFCRQLFLDGHYSMAVLKAFIYINNTVKELSGIAEKDGSSLMKVVLSAHSPVLMLNPLQSQSERDQQLGYMEMFAGSMTGVRNPRAYEHDLVDTSAEAFEMLVMANHLMRVLNNATHTGGIS